MDLGLFDVAHGVVVANDQRQARHHHHSAVGHVAVKQIHRVGSQFGVIKFTHNDGICQKYRVVF